MNVFDYVIIKNDIFKVIYIIEEINEDKALIKGFTKRIRRYVDVDNLELASAELINKEKIKSTEYISKMKKMKTRLSHKPLFGRILHIDGDLEYLESCKNFYEEIGIPAECIYIKEKEVKNKIEELILYLTPDIVVITGHDIYNGNDIKDLNNYENTSYFIEAVRIIRKHFENICVIVGACCSNFDALIASGANFASSPKRINIHTYDPAVIAIKVASTSIDKLVDFNSCIKLIENGKDAFGGVETKGKMKMLL